jgi:hypothetical protein
MNIGDWARLMEIAEHDDFQDQLWTAVQQLTEQDGKELSEQVRLELRDLVAEVNSLPPARQAQTVAALVSLEKVLAVATREAFACHVNRVLQLVPADRNAWHASIIQPGPDQTSPQNGSEPNSIVEKLRQENRQLREERLALLRAMFPSDAAVGIKPADYAFEVTSIDKFLEDLKDPTAR